MISLVRPICTYVNKDTGLCCNKYAFYNLPGKKT